MVASKRNSYAACVAWWNAEDTTYRVRVLDERDCVTVNRYVETTNEVSAYMSRLSL